MLLLLPHNKLLWSKTSSLLLETFFSAATSTSRVLHAGQSAQLGIVVHLSSVAN